MIRLSLFLTVAVAAPALAAPPSASPFPLPRPEWSVSAPAEVQATTLPRVVVEVIDEAVPEPEPVDIATLAANAIEAADDAEPTATPEISPLAAATSPRPTPRGDIPESFLEEAEERGRAYDAALAARSAEPTRDPDFLAWITDFQSRARAAGISQGTLNRAFEGVQLQEGVLERDRNQAEFSRALWDYLDTAVSDARIRNGRDNLAEWRTTLGRIEEQYQVEAEVVVAVWGLESAYGATRGSTDIIAAMATLAYDGRRQEFFEEQLIAALQILQSGDTSPRNMVGSWAGAMGHTQFMPTSYLEYAQDFNGDGRRNIWGDNPVDALASTAHYLAEHGWTYGQPWGLEVRLPEGFDYRLAGEQERIGVAFWNGQGVRLMNGDPIPDHGPASLRLPMGAEGVALITFNNFRVIERYNPADAYVIAIGHLSDRIEGGPDFRASWPRGDRALSFAERQEMQRHLQAAGYYAGNIDGLVGPITIAAVRAYQEGQGLVPDGYASLSILERLRNG
ncbi:lytic murein transglycosylase [Gymnodinialimonas hymeniacidonis]|uniref:lytic murein transglycosylase n=1 Tax=Gymnodinialimonas hymeniacidonis TaxID=3126508 RepID=UPI0034C687D8